MLNRRVTFWAAITLIAILALSGCAPRVGQGSLDVDSDQLVIDLPALVLDIGADGSVSIHECYSCRLGFHACRWRRIGFAHQRHDRYVFMSMANIQHIQVSNTPEGLLLLVNGLSIPSISYDGDSLSALPGAINEFSRYRSDGRPSGRACRPNRDRRHRPLPHCTGSGGDSAVRRG